jgi:4-alpha-glucanotransferase
MHSDPYEIALDNAAREWRIEPEYWDIFRRRHVTSAETKRAILRGFGVDTSTAESLERALVDRRWREWNRPLPPTLVTGPNPAVCALRVPAGFTNARVDVSVTSEDGETWHSQTRLAEAPERDEAEFDGVRYIEKQIALPSGLPHGYHELSVRVDDGPAASARLIVAPDCAFEPEFLSGQKAAGIAIALYGVRSERNWGCGDFRDLRGVVDWAADELKVSFVALNPLHAIHNRRPFNSSPYLPNCIFYQNFIYLDVEAIEDFANSRRAQCAWRSSETQREAAGLRAATHVEYERVAALKLRLLKLAFTSFLREFRKGSPRVSEFRKFVAGEGELLERFATYCALDEHLHRGNPDLWVWTEWPEPHRDPESPQTREFRKRYWRRVMFYQYLQWLLDQQLRAAHEYAKQRLSIGLYHDLALATDRFGSDLWAHRPFFATGCRVGSPPDDFSPNGQDWGFPPPHSDRHFEDGYRLFAQSIRRNCRYGGALRIDHVMRFFRLYWIPDEVDATAGAYVRDRHEDLVRVLALESCRHGVLIVGEDLGTVEPVVQQTLAAFGMFSYRLLYFEKHQNGHFKAASEYPVQALVSSTTHDLPTLAGFWMYEDIRARRRAEVIDDAGFHAQLENRNREKQKLLDLFFAHQLLPEGYPRDAARLPEWTGELHNAAIGFLASTPSRLLVVNQEDLTKETHQQNLPATTWQYPNWSWKTPFRVEDLGKESPVSGFARMFAGWLEKTGRIDPKRGGRP